MEMIKIPKEGLVNPELYVEQDAPFLLGPRADSLFDLCKDAYGECMRYLITWYGQSRNNFYFDSQLMLCNLSVTMGLWVSSLPFEYQPMVRWQIVCAESNNPPHVLAADDLRVDIHVSVEPSVVTILRLSLKDGSIERVRLG